jgi:CxxC motif-containing protein (DUF1111 family)
MTVGRARLLALGSLAFVACGPAPAEPDASSVADAAPSDDAGTDADIDGGADAGPATPSLGSPRADLTAAERDAFDRGRALFTHAYTPAEGLGPLYNDTSCGSCHRLPTLGGAGDDTNTAAIGPGPGGTDVTLYRRQAVAPAVPPTAPADATRRFAPPLFGLVFLEQVPDATIRAGCGTGHADQDGDGTVDRFGARPFVPTLRRFVATALFAEMGLTNPLVGTTDGDSVADPEVSLADIDSITAFLSGLDRPPVITPTDPAGAALFDAWGCSGCHRPDTGPSARGAYTDLCVHHMGAALADGITDHTGGPDELRSTPLWGLRFRERFLHDGRALTVDDAVRAHGGDADAAASAWAAASDADRASVLAFLSTL